MLLKMVMQWLALLLHTKKVLDLIPGPDRTFLCGACIMLPLPAKVSSGSSGSPNH